MILVLFFLLEEKLETYTQVFMKVSRSALHVEKRHNPYQLPKVTRSRFISKRHSFLLTSPLWCQWGEDSVILYYKASNGYEIVWFSTLGHFIIVSDFCSLPLIFFFFLTVPVNEKCCAHYSNVCSNSSDRFPSYLFLIS